MALVYITCKDSKEAGRISMHLLRKRLITCANIFPIKSLYWWKGKIVNGNEVVSIFKTQKKNWTKVKTEIKKMHSYQVPCIEKMEVEAGIDYENWVKEVTK